MSSPGWSLTQTLLTCGLCGIEGRAGVTVGVALVRWNAPSEHAGRTFESMPRCKRPELCRERFEAAHPGTPWPVLEAYAMASHWAPADVQAAPEGGPDVAAARPDDGAALGVSAVDAEGPDGPAPLPSDSPWPALDFGP